MKNLIVAVFTRPTAAAWNGALEKRSEARTTQPESWEEERREQ